LINECFDVVKYIYENASMFNIDSNKILLAGDSAGIHVDFDVFLNLQLN